MILAEQVDWFAIVERFGLPVSILVIILYTGYKNVWVWGRHVIEQREDLRAQLQKMEEEKNEWKHLALAGVKVVEASIKSPSPVTQQLEDKIVEAVRNEMRSN